MSGNNLSGMSPVETRTCLLICTAAMILTGLLYLPGLGELQLTREEPRRALIAQTMLDSGDYWVPQLIEKTYTAKPPLYNQFIALLSSGGDATVTEFSARLTSVISVMLLLPLMIFLTRRFLGFNGLLFLGLGLVLSPEILVKGRLAEIDMLFTLFVSGSLWLWFALYEGKQRGFGVWTPPILLVVLAFLTKREPAILFFYTAVIPYLIWRRDLKALLTPAHLLSVGLMFGLISLAYMPVINRLGWDPFWANTVHEANDLQGQFHLTVLLKNLVLYPLKVFGALFPYSLPLLALLMRPIRQAVWRRDNSHVVFAALVALISLPLYSIPEEPKVRYFLPLFPSILVFAAVVFESVVSNISEGRVSSVMRFDLVTRVVLTVLTIGVSAALLYKLYAPDHAAYFPTTIQIVSLLFIMLLMLASQRLERLRNNRTMLTLLCMSLTVFAFRQFYQLPREMSYQAAERDTGSVQSFLEKHVTEELRPVLLKGELPYDLFFYIANDLITPTGCGSSPCAYLLGYEDKLRIAGIDLAQWQETGETVHFKRESLILYRRRD